MDLKPNEELMAATAAVTSVYLVFSSQVPNMADIRAAKPGNPVVHGSIKGATIESAALISGLALIAKSPTVFVIGGMATVALAWHYHWANHVEPSTGRPGQAA